MEIDEELAQKMRRIREREDELGREKEEVRHFARAELGQIQGLISELREKIAGLEERRDQISNLLGISIADNPVERLAHGALKEMCIEALQNSTEGLRSGEVKAWVLRKHPDARVSSIPATLSRQTEQGIFLRDSLGRYKIR